MSVSVHDIRKRKAKLGSLPWLGQVKAGKTWLSFEKARELTHAQGFKNWKEFREWKKPPGVPTTPERIYKEKWVSTGDFLGTGFINGDWLPFEEARALVRAKTFSGLEEFYAWKERLAHRIPSRPETTYKDSGWVDWFDFLGNPPSKWHHKNFKSFDDARAVVRAARLTSQKEFKAWQKKKPDIPSNPNSTYEKEWIDWIDWLGNDWLPFDEARAVVHAQKFRNQREFYAWEASVGITKAPKLVYKNEWAGWSDWLGTGVAARKTTTQHVIIAERLAKEHGVLPTANWLIQNGYSGTYSCLLTNPNAFGHIPRDKSKKTLQEHIKDAEALSKEHKDVVPCKNWLKKNGFGGLARCIWVNPEAFAHLKQERHNTSHAYVAPAQPRTNARRVSAACSAIPQQGFEGSAKRRAGLD